MCSRTSMQLVLLAGLLLGTAVAQTIPAAAEQQVPTMQLQQEEQVMAYPLTQLPGCNASSDASFNLPVGLTDECEVESNLTPKDPLVLMFSISEGVEMSAIFTLHVEGGAASMSIWFPGTSADSPPDLIQNELYSSPASSEGWIAIPPEVLATRPGQYLISITAFSGKPSVTLTVRTPGSDLQLVTAERDLLRGFVETCCTGEEKPEESKFCAIIAPQTLADDHPWQTDFCHLAPSSCNAAGHLTTLALPGLGITCPTFPAQLGKLKYLRRLDLTGNNFEAATMQDVAEVVAGLTSLEELDLGATRLGGNLTCDLPATVKLLDVAYNQLEGPLPSCLVNSLEELYVPGNVLSGPLPAPTPTSPLKTLFANLQRGEGLSGTIPVAIGSLRNLQYIDLGGNNLRGALPGLPRSIKIFNISGNSVKGQLGGMLPPGLWQLDISNNDISGAMPELDSLADLEVLVTSNNNRMIGTLPALPEGLVHLEAVGCGLRGAFPGLPSSIRRLDLSDNKLTGDVSDIDATDMEVLRLANNSLTGSVPATAASSPQLFLLDLHGNRLTGSLPAEWTGHRMQMVMLEDNAITGTIPASLAALPNLGVLRLGHNKLSGDLTDFADTLATPNPTEEATAAAAAGTSSTFISRLFDFNVTANQLTGPVPDQLALAGLFNPNITFLMPGDYGEAAVLPRSMDLSGNKLAGAWPQWLLKAVPSTLGVCGCSITVKLSGANMHLSCPPDNSTVAVTDYMWQTAAEQQYTCWDGQHQLQLLDYLRSPSNTIDNADLSSIAMGDGGGLVGGNDSKRKAILAGAIIGVLLGCISLSLIGYFVVYEKLIKPGKATAFQKFEDDNVAAAAAGAVAGVGGSISMQTLPITNGVEGAAAGPAAGRV